MKVKKPFDLEANKIVDLADPTNAQDAATKAYVDAHSVSDGDKGDITVSGSGATWTIDNDVVTYAKMQNVSATDRLLGRDTAAAGDVEELTVGGGLEFTGTGGIQRSAISGDVTIAAGSNTAAITADTIVNADVNSSAAIAWNKLATGTPDRVMITNFSGNVTANAVITATELSYLDNASSELQAQINLKAPLASPTFTGTVVLPSTTSIGTISNTELATLDGITASTAELNVLDGITATTTELNYTDGLTSSAQTQLDAKIANVSGLALRQDASFEGGQIGLARSTDNTLSWYFDVYGNTSTPSLRVVDNVAAAARLTVDSTGNVDAVVSITTPTAAADTNSTRVATTAFVLAQAASQAEQEAASSTTKFVTSGRQQFHPSAAKCWAVVTVAAAVPTLRTSYNITSITDTNTGQLTITIANDFSSANWACIATVERAATGLGVAADRKVAVRNATKAAGSVVLECYDSTATTMLAKDPESWSMVGFGDI